MFGLCLEDSGILNGNFDCVWKVSGKFLEGVWKVYEKSKSGLRLGVS